MWLTQHGGPVFVLKLVVALWLGLSVAIGVVWSRAHRARPTIRRTVAPPRPREDSDLAS
jgi:hypothetical protein